MNGDRHDALGDIDPTVAKLLRKRRKHLRPPSEVRRTKVTYDLPPALAEEIRAIAKELGVPNYAVARKFLEYALEAYRRGDLTLKRRPVVTTYDLE